MDIDWDKVEKDIASFGVNIYPLEECIIGDCLGSGSVMEVFEGKCNTNAVSRNVAFKRHMKFKSSTLEQKDVNKILQDLQHEITLMKRLNNPTNIVQIYGVTFETKKPVLIVELGNQTLSIYLLDKAKSGTPATWREKIKFCDDVSRGIRCLHNAGIIHGNIKGDNVLVFIKSTGITTAKLSGFGYSSTPNSSHGDVSRKKIVMAPEARGIGELKAWAEKPTQDIFNFGLAIYQVANDGKTPHEDAEEILKVDSTNRHIEALLANLRPDTPEVFRIMVTSTTRYMPTERASLDIVEKIIYDFQNVSSSQQVNAVNTPLKYLGPCIESQQSHLLAPSALETIPHSLPDSKKSDLDEPKNNSKEAELNEVKRICGKVMNTLESYIILNDVLDVNKLPIPPSLKLNIFHEYQQLAEIGDPFAHYMSGVCWINGFGTEKSDLKAVECFTKAAEAGNGPAQNILGFCYKTGRGVVKDIPKAIKLYIMAAEAGNPKAQYNLGLAHENGEGIAKDYIKAFQWYTKAAEANFLRAQTNLGFCYEEGKGVTKDMIKAVEWYKKAAEDGEATAQNCLGTLYEKGCGVTMDLAKAFELYTKAAEAGDPEAQYNLGLCYEYGKRVTKDSTKAAEWYKKAAEAGNASAQNNLGYFYEKGIGGVTKNYTKAFEWYKKGAEDGDCWAQHNVGHCYQYGNGVYKNEFKAVEWYTKSAEAGNTWGQTGLAYCYEKGIGIIKDYSKAIELYTKAAKVGYDVAQLRLDELKRNITP